MKHYCYCAWCGLDLEKHASRVLAGSPFCSDCDRPMNIIERDNERLRKLVQYCRMRLKKDAYRDYVDKCLADLSLLDTNPEMQGRMVQS